MAFWTILEVQKMSPELLDNILAAAVVGEVFGGAMGTLWAINKVIWRWRQRRKAKKEAGGERGES